MRTNERKINDVCWKKSIIQIENELIGTKSIHSEATEELDGVFNCDLENNELAVE